MNENMTLHMNVAEKISYSLLATGSPLINGLELENLEDAPIENITVTIRDMSSFLEPIDLHVSMLAARSRIALLPAIGWNASHAAHLTEAETVTLHAEALADGKTTARTDASTTLLPSNHWPGIVYATNIASFVCPNDPAIDPILGAASTDLRNRGYNIPFSGYGNGSDDSWRILEAVWRTLAGQGINYALPPACFEEAGQKVRFHAQTLSSKLGTCLDLAVLFAACVEQVGLQAVIVFIKGHAFPACCMKSDIFRTAIGTDAAEVRNLVGLRELIPVETTLLCGSHPSKFGDACAKAVSELDDDTNFICIVDVAHARTLGVKPLSTGSDGSIVIGPEPVQHHADETQRPDTDIPRFSVADSVVDQAPRESPAESKLNRWKLKLLDLSLRNAMLNFKVGKKNVLVDLPDPNKLEDMLSENESFHFISGIDLIADRTDTPPAKEDIPELMRHLAEECLDKHLLVIGMSANDLDAALLGMFRDARLREEETGSPMLYLAFGFLRWYEKENSDAHDAPLVLLPVRLSRRSIKSGFTLSSGDGEPMFNFTLAEKLRRDFAMTGFFKYREGLPRDEHGLDINGILDFVATSIKGIAGWEVRRNVGLGIFSFAKYLMWQNLGESNILNECESIRRVLGMKTDVRTRGASFVEPEAMDRSYRPYDIHVPLPADSSQLSAIAAADKGSFVLIGPPGTGKSQTIANMIAYCIGKGLTVLFVAEKSAALNVVYSRLKNVGLGTLCLELHSSKAQKKEVIGQIRASYELRPKDFDRRKAESKYEELRDGLNGYDEELHRRQPNGRTIFEASGIVAKWKDVPQLPLRATPSMDDGKDLLDGRLGAAKQLGIHAAAVRAHFGSGLESIRNDDFSPKWKRDLTSLTADFNAYVEEARRQVCKAEQHMPGLTALLDSAGPAKALAFVRAIASLGDAESFVTLFGTGSVLLETLRKCTALCRTFQRKKSDISSPTADTMRADILAKFGDGALRRQWDAARESFFFRSRKMGKIVDEVRLLYANGAEIDLSKDLPVWEELLSLAGRINDAAVGLDALPDWKGPDTNPDVLERLLDAAHTIEHAVGDPIPDVLLDAMRTYEKCINEDSAMASAIRQRYHDAESALGRLVGMASDLHRLVDGTDGPDAEVVIGTSDDVKFLMELHRVIEAKAGALHEWCDWNKAAHAAEAAGLHELVDAVRTGMIEPDQAEQTYLVNYMRLWLLEAMESAPVLRSFTSSKQEQTIGEFKEADRQMLGSAVSDIMSAIPDRESLMDAYHEEALVLKKQLTLKRAHMPVRRLIKEMPHLLPRLLPCFLMSPLSVAQYLEWKHSFDVVIFDEASQIPIWEALGALGHGEHVIVVGDPKQLPPTSFFQKEDTAEGDEPDMESILDQCVASRFPERRLLWHYRSRREGLIAFSNRRYYDGRLLTFPSPNADDSGVEWHFVSDGCYAKGKTRTNLQEARAIAAHVVSLLRDQADDGPDLRSIGIVTFNLQQARLIEDLLDEERRRHPDIERFFRDDCQEPVLVKNLENIQGDERDILFFSICFGKDESGRLSYNFGALNRDGGERRLNVAITRARRQIHVYSSIRAGDVPADRPGGVRDLRDFLDYAEHGPSALTVTDMGSLGGFESPFEEAVAAGLERKGWQLRTQVGIAGFRIDLGVVNPDMPGKYLAGVECDGATYHSAATARDRDILRENVLRGLGWNILRVWSTDWWQNADGCMENLDTALHGLLDEFRRTTAAGNIVSEAPTDDMTSSPDDAPTERTTETATPSAEDDGTVQDDRHLFSHLASPTSGPRSGTVPTAPDAPKEHRQDGTADMIDVLINANWPIREDKLLTLYANGIGVARAGAAIRAKTAAWLAGYPTTIDEETNGRFLWPKGTDPSAVREFPPRDSMKRTADAVCMEELRSIARLMGNPGDDPAKCLSSRLGIARLSESARRRLQRAWDTRSEC